jgi:hypothetical protein
MALLRFGASKLPQKIHGFVKVEIWLLGAESIQFVTFSF